MADNSILTPGYQNPTQDTTEISEDTKYLAVDNYLSEYSSDEQKSVVRENLNVPAKDNVYSKQDTDTQISQKIQQAIQDYLNLEDPHGIIPIVEDMIADMVKSDGSTPFKLPQTGVDPQTDYHLATKKYVDKLVQKHVSANDPHQTLSTVQNLLKNYVKLVDIYSKQDLYTKQETDQKLKDYIKKDGSTPFTKAQIGVDPSIDSHLATKRYVDKSLYNHLIEVDPHNFISILNSRLAYYIKKKDVYDKTQTYSRTQIDSIINKIVNSAIESSLQDYQDSVDSKFEQIRNQNYVKSDGSVPFTQPQQGVEAVNENELVTLKQLNTAKEESHTELVNYQPEWITSGPVEATVGQVEEQTEFPEQVTFQELMDAIFYGKAVSVDVPDYTNITESCDVLLCIHGSLSLVETIELYQKDTIIGTYSKEDFQDGCITVKSNPILEDTIFTFKVTYSNGAVHQAEDTTKVSLPVFIGLLPKWKYGNTVTMEYLKELEQQDVNGTQNRFMTYGSDLESISFFYKFQDPDLRHIFVVLPESYPDLEYISTSSQKFEKDAFDVIDMIPLQIEGVEGDTIFKMYIYKQALSSLNQEVTFKFNNNESVQ